jgi:hypothetical protein
MTLNHQRFFRSSKLPIAGRGFLRSFQGTDSGETGPLANYRDDDSRGFFHMTTLNHFRIRF